MPKILLIGDIHGKIDAWNSYHHNSKADFSIALGDIGIGFPASPSNLNLQSNQYFIRGNHDNPLECRKLKPNYLGDYTLDQNNSIFYISGAASLPWDRINRIEGRTIWHDEELTDTNFNEILNLVLYYRPKIIISHECPLSLHNRLFGYNTLYPSKTSIFMDKLLDVHQPEAWYFGHHHRSNVLTFQGIHFQCLAELEILTITV